MKKALIIGGVAIAVLATLASKKIGNISEAVKGLKVKITSLKNVRFSGGNIVFDLDISITNNTLQDLNVNTFGAILLKEITFSNSVGEVIGSSYPNLTNINIPSGQTVIYKGLETQLPLGNIGLALNTALNVLKNPALLNISADLETPTGIYTING